MDEKVLGAAPPALGTSSSLHHGHYHDEMHRQPPPFHSLQIDFYSFWPSWIHSDFIFVCLTKMTTSLFFFCFFLNPGTWRDAPEEKKTTKYQSSF